MKQVRQQNVAFYDERVRELYARYQAIGSRAGDISLAFSYMQSPQMTRVLEIGCGYGREAAEILRYTPFYTGLDASAEFIALAQDYVPAGRFVRADAVEYDYPGRYDMVLSFAALRHFDQDELRTILRKVHQSVSPQGIVYLSMNYGHTYMQQTWQDDHGQCVYYLYNPALVAELAGPGYEVVTDFTTTIGDTMWFEIILRKY